MTVQSGAITPKIGGALMPKGDMEQVSWNDVQAFIQKLNAKTGKQYRLPSEAEWEYACHAGGRQAYCGSDDLDSVAWHEGNSGNRTHPVAEKQANAFGLYDMSGNVWEWVEDSHHADYNGAPADGSAWQGDGANRVLRGGSWIVSPRVGEEASVTSRMICRIYCDKLSLSFPRRRGFFNETLQSDTAGG